MPEEEQQLKHWMLWKSTDGKKTAISEREHSFLFRGCLRFLLVIIKDANIDLKIAFVIILT